MKRPEGFDPAAKQPPAPSPSRPKAAAPKAAAPKAPAPKAPKAPKAQKAQTAQPTPNVAAPRKPVATPQPPSRTAELRRAARERRKFERGEIRRFTRRTRSRRTFWLSVAAIVAVLVTVLAVAVFSPILALRTITIEGTSRIAEKDVLKAVDGQLGTPLALVDLQQLERDLSGFPLIRSYVTETVPPNTLVIHIQEREPVGVMQRGDSFDLVDPAGISVQTTAERPADVPLIVVDGGKTDGAAFDSAVEVLLALPPAMLAQVDTITASTQDDVRFVLRGVGQSVIWGSADRSAYKARVLSALFAKTKQSVKYEYDVSAPESAVITRR